jgi:hypothetical protein
MTHPIEEVRAAERLRFNAMLAKDIQILTDLLDEKLIYVHSTGRCMTKAEYLAHVRDAGFDYLSIDATPNRETTTSDGTVVLVQNVAASIRVPSVAHPIQLKLAVLTVWCASLDGWRLISSISSPMAERRNG